jgi:hypothetical protein
MLNWIPRRIRLVSAAPNRTSGQGRRFDVKLERPNGESFIGKADANDTATNDLRAAAEATLEALRGAIGEDAKIELRGVLPFSAFGENMIVVGIKVTHQGRTQRLFGLSPVIEDRGRAAALATLNAANRYLGLG